MQIQDLQVGTELTLQVLWGNTTYDIPTKIVLSQNGRVFISAFTYNGVTVNLADIRNYRGMVFHLYDNNADVGARLIWRNVNLDIKDVNGKVYYEVNTNSFSAESVEEERRNQHRLSVNVECSVLVDDELAPFKARLHDLSQGGLSFTLDKNRDIVTKRMVVTFEDSVLDHDFHLAVKCKCIRMNEQGKDTYLFGCMTNSMDRDTLAYISLKTMKIVADANAKEKEAEEAAAAEEKA